jgi:glycosyltransferase involved in cell wall biosynthesis
MKHYEKFAVLIPCYNESITIEKVIRDFQKYLPGSQIYVYDNNSTDGTGMLASKAGAIIKNEPRQGKGNVMRSMFRDIDAEFYVLIDGDDTYPVEALPQMIDFFMSHSLDILVGDRLSNGTYFTENKRMFHNFGNRLVLSLINYVFSSELNDIMSGYRIMSRAFVKNYPVLSDGFQVETEMTVFALNYKWRYMESPIAYRDRPEGSFSKLDTIRDGFRVLKLLYNLSRNTKPLLFFGLISSLFLVLSLGVGTPVILEFVRTRYITLIPSAILASSLAITAFIFLLIAFVLDAFVYYNQIQFQHKINSYFEKEQS